MIAHRPFRALLATAAFALAGCLSPTAAFAQGAGNTVRPEVGKPLQAAEGLFKQKRHKEALAKVAEAEAVANKTPHENDVVLRTKASIAAAAGDYETAAKSFEAALALGRSAPADQLKMVQAIAGLHYNAKDYAKSAQWATRYSKDGGTDPAMRTVLVQSYFLQNDCASVSKVVGNGGTEGGRKPAEQELQIMANCYLKQKDSTGYATALERLVTHYPKKEYWTDLLNRVQKKSGFSDRLSLDVYRLKLATGNVTTANDYLEMTQLAIHAGFPAEAKAIVDKGYAANALGTGKDAERHKRLRDLTARTLAEYTKGRAQAEKDAQADKAGNALVTIGYNYVAEGAPQDGLAYMEEGIKKGSLKRPEDAKLLLGVAQLRSGARARGLQTLRSVHGNDGTADLARLWMLVPQRS